MQPTHEEAGFRPHIEGLRAVAIFLVVAFHVGVDRFFLRFGTSYIAGGYVGVDVFYVISGFLITGGLVGELERAGRISLPRFYARRIRRLVPMGALTLIATLGASVLLLPRLDWPDLARDSAAAAAFLANVSFATQMKSYLAADTAESPFLHYWSLSIEEQFYLVLPLIIVATVRASGADAAPRRKISRVLAAVLVASFAASVWETERGGPWAYYGTHTRAWELAVGGLLACHKGLLGRLTPSVAKVLGWGGLAAIGAAFVFYDRSTPFPGFAAVTPVVGAAAILVAGEAAPGAGAARLLSLRPLMFVGRLSYSWYLLHWPFIVLAGPATWATGRPDASVVLAAAGLSFVAAAIANALVESPLRRSEWLLAGRTPLFVLAGSLVIVSACSVLLVTASGGGDESATSPRGAKLDRVRLSDGCEHDFDGATTTPCAFGDPAGNGELVLIGDSHASQLVPAFDSLARKRGLRGSLYAKASCPPFDVRRLLPAYRREYVECGRWRDGVFAILAERPPIGVVLARFGGYGNTLLGDDGAMARAHDRGAVWEAGVRRTLSRLSRLSVPVFVIRDTPNPRFDVPRCIDQQGAAACTFSRARHGRWDGELFAGEHLALADFPSVTLVDLTDAVCPTEDCTVVDGKGVIKFRDGNHLTATFARALEPDLAVVLGTRAGGS